MAVPRSSSTRTRPRFAQDQGFRKQLDQRVMGYFSANGRSHHGDWRMHLKTLTLFAWFGASYAFLLLGATTWWHGLLGVASLALAVAGLGFSVQHDANHGAYSRSGVVNGILERTLDLLGASSYLWRWKHNVFHHTYTNVAGADHDIALMPFARLTPREPLHGMHRFQHLYMWALYGFIVFHMHFVEDFHNIRSGKVGTQTFPRPTGTRLIEVFTSKLLVLGWALIIPMFFHTWWVVLAFYVGLWFTVGFILGVVFQVAHCYDEAEFPEMDPDTQRMPDEWAIHQVKTTANFSPRGRLISWYVGGLNFQIEHHLFPKVCHVHYPRIAPIVREVCAEYGVPYTSYSSFPAALASHGRLLRRMGRPAPQPIPVPARS